MGWDANSESDEAYHRRRFAVACVGLLGALAVIGGAVIDANRSFSYKSMLDAFFGLALLGFFGLMASREGRRARAAADRR